MDRTSNEALQFHGSLSPSLLPFVIFTLTLWVRCSYHLFYWCENRLKDAKYLVQGHIVSRWRSQGLNMDLCPYPLAQRTWLAQSLFFVSIPSCERSVWVHRQFKTCPIQQKPESSAFGAAQNHRWWLREVWWGQTDQYSNSHLADDLNKSLPPSEPVSSP